MNSPNEKKQAQAQAVPSDAAGLTITRPSPSRQPSAQSIPALTTIDDVDSTHTLTPTHTRHNEKSSLSVSESKQNIHESSSLAYDTDVEACLSQQKTEQGSNRMSMLKNKSSKEMECSVWPGQKQLKAKKKQMRKERGKHNLCGWMAGMPKTTQMWIKILIAALVIGGAVGVGIGISRAVGGGIWKTKDNTNAPLQGNAS